MASKKSTTAIQFARKGGTPAADASARLYRYGNSYQRLPMLLDMARRMSRSDWLIVLGEQWSGFDNIAQYQHRLRPLLASLDVHDRALLMTEDEREALAALPEVIPVYRGCYESNLNGLSWTTDNRIAARFPLMLRYRQDGTPLLASGTVPRSSAILKLDRDEFEVIAHAVAGVTVEALPQAGVAA